jgi:hypothetical protein
MRIPMLYAGGVFQTLKEVEDTCKSKPVKFKILKIKKGLEDAISILRPLLTEDDFQWLMTTTSFDFEPLAPEDLEAFESLTPEQARNLCILLKTN